MVPLPASELLVVISGFVVAFALAFGIGANDVANSFGTSVGSKAISLRTACILATFCELSGSILLGSRVSSTIRKNMLDLSQFNSTPRGDELLMNGYLSALSGSCIWLFLATLCKLPVSGSHSIVGSTIGFSLVRFGKHGISWRKVGEIIGSWVLSPVASGVVSTIFFFVIKKVVLEKEKPLEPALMTLPFLYGIIIAINTFVVVIDGLENFSIDLPSWAKIATPIGAGLVTAVLVLLIFVPLQRRKILKNLEKARKRALGENHFTEENATPYRKALRTVSRLVARCRRTTTRHGCDNEPDFGVMVRTDLTVVSSEADLLQELTTTQSSIRVSPERNLGSLGDVNSLTKEVSDSVLNRVDLEASEPPVSPEPLVIANATGVITDRPEEAQVFCFAQILTAMFGSFAHGGNDVSNAIGPLIGIWILAVTGEISSKVATPIGILVYGGVGISIGLWAWGRRVIETVGKNLSTITPSSGVAIEIGSAVTVLLASKFGLPISTTHCKVGSVICVGRFRSKENVNWRLFGDIILAWVLTLPVSCGLSAFIMWLLTRHIP